MQFKHRHSSVENSGWKKIYHANSKHQRAGMATLIADKTDFKTKSMNKVSDPHFLTVKRSVHHQDIAIKNVYIPNHRSLKYMR